VRDHGGPARPRDEVQEFPPRKNGWADDAGFALDYQLDQRMIETEMGKGTAPFPPLGFSLLLAFRTLS